jgi:alpha-glucosidase
MTNPNGTEYIGQVWPGYTVHTYISFTPYSHIHFLIHDSKVFPDWFANNTQSWWTEAFQNWSSSGITFDGIWLDMNEAASFCDGSW